LLDAVDMKLKRVLFGLLALPACTVDVGRGTTSQSIVGGQEAMPSEFPTVLGLEDTPGNWFCTASLITDQWVLTAAHCVEGATGISIRLDDPDINTAGGGTTVAVAEVHSNPMFDWEAWDNDIALLKLAQPVTDRQPTPIYRQGVPFGTPVIDVGYGVADNDGNGGGILRKVSKVTVDCAGANDPGISNDNLVCMDATDGSGSCFGDSGGPTFATFNNQRYVAGVTSGGSGDGSCGQGLDLYTSIMAELPWIDSVMQASPTPDPDPEPDPDPDPNPDPNPDPDPTGEGDKDGDKDTGGCNAGAGNSGTLIMLAFVGLVVRRRRRV
jgi:uncharacterized protein (TIGR03382 family)